MPFDADAPAISKTKLTLQKARDLIAKGWCQRTEYQRPIGSARKSYCSIGALKAAAGYGYEQPGKFDRAAYVEARNFMGKIMGVDELEIVVWNDWPGRTLAQVLAKFDEAIERTE